MKNIDGNDILFFTGLFILIIGLWLYKPWLSLSVAGAILMWIGYGRAGGD